MKYTAVLIDDESFVHRDVRFRLKSVTNLGLAALFLSVDEAMAYFEHHPEGVDVIFCDIRMPDVDGYEAYQLLNGYCDMFVFLTAKHQHGEEIFEAPSVGYLRKPIDAAKVSLILDRLGYLRQGAALAEKADKIFFVYDRFSEVDIPVKVKDILRIDIELKYAEVKVANRERNLLIQDTLTAVVRKLRPSGLFVRINRSCVLSINAIKGIDKNYVIYFADGTSEPVNRTYQQAFKAFMKRHRLG